MGVRVFSTNSRRLAERVRIRLAEARLTAGLSQGDVAERVGWHRPTVWYLEQGLQRMTLLDLSDMAAVYGVRVSDIVLRAERDIAIGDAE